GIYTYARSFTRTRAHLCQELAADGFFRDHLNCLLTNSIHFYAVVLTTCLCPGANERSKRFLVFISDLLKNCCAALTAYGEKVAVSCSRLGKISGCEILPPIEEMLFSSDTVLLLN